MRNVITFRSAQSKSRLMVKKSKARNLKALRGVELRKLENKLPCNSSDKNCITQPGELVEVRQREIGFRGSWHPAKVVKIDAGQGLVEYEKLLSKDGSPRFQEYVPLSEDGATILLRPRPPPLVSSDGWQRGLWVDAFYGDAWWEGVLMDDVSETMQVFFPDEGDRRSFCTANLRVSQDWNNRTGAWTVKGKWTEFASIEGRKFRLKRTFAVQPKRIESSGKSEKVGKSGEDCEEDGKRKKTESEVESIDSDDDESLSHWLERHRKQLRISQEQADGGQTVPASLEDVPATDVEVDGEPDHESSPVLDTSTVDVDACGHEPSLKTTDDADKLQPNREEMDTAARDDGKEELDMAADGGKEQPDVAVDGVTEEPDVATDDGKPEPDVTMDDGKEQSDVALDGEPDVATDNGKREPDVTMDDGTEERDTDGKEPTGTEHTEEAGQLVPFEVMAVGQCVLSSETAVEEAGKRQEVNEESIVPDFRDTKLLKKWVDRDTFTGESPSKGPAFVTAWNKTKKLLVDSGWTIRQSFRERFSRNSQEPYCVSPEGKPYVSLASACREWMRRNKHVKERRISHLQLIARGDYDCPAEFLAHAAGDTVHGNSAERQSSRARRMREETMEEPYRNKKLKTKGDAEKKKGRPRTVCRLEAARTRHENDEEVRLSKRLTLISWLIDMGVLSEHEKVQYLNKETNALYSGEISGDGILCSCCKETFSISAFQVHAGSSVHSTASQMRLQGGRSILDCQLAALKVMKTKESEVVAESQAIEVDENDETCAVCGDGGQLVCCDHCPSTFHLKCVQLEKVPEGDWFCPRCCCASCGSNLYDPDNQADILYCDQCEREYHTNCLYGEGMKYKAGDNRFCSRKCLKIFQGLRKLVGRSNTLDAGYTWRLLRSELQQSNLETIAENSSRLALALSVIQECFRPMIDPRTKTDILTHILFNQRGDDKRLDYRGFYTLLLERGDELISVASIRIHGAHAAEIPFIGTRLQYRRQGMCRRLLNVTEQFLQALEVQTLVLPAIAEFAETWTGTFGFQKLSAAQGVQLMELNIVTFPGTSILHKSLTWLHCGKRPPPAEERLYLSLLNDDVFDDDEKQEISEPKRVTDTAAPPAERKRIIRIRQLDPSRKLNMDSARESEPDNDDHQEPLKQRVVIAKTRSNRVVRSSSWIADGLKSLRRKFLQLSDEQPVEEEEAEEEKEEELPVKKDSRSCTPKEGNFWSDDDLPPTSPIRTFTRRRSKTKDVEAAAAAAVAEVDKRLIKSANLEAVFIANWPKSKRSARPKPVLKKLQLQPVTRKSPRKQR